MADILTYMFTEEDIDSCWLCYKSYLIDILNREYTIEAAREDLFSLIGSKYDCRIKEEKEAKTLEELIWECKYCGQNEKPKCIKCVREDGLLVTDELVED